MQVEGYGYEFDAMYFGGPADGWKTNIVTFGSSLPPEISYVEINNVIGCKTSIGRYFFRQEPARSARIAVYMLDERGHGDEIADDFEEELRYLFIETMAYGDYLSEYGDN